MCEIFKFKPKQIIIQKETVKNVKMQISCAVTHPDMTFMGI